MRNPLNGMIRYDILPRLAFGYRASAVAQLPRSGVTERNLGVMSKKKTLFSLPFFAAAFAKCVSPSNFRSQSSPSREEG